MSHLLEQAAGAEWRAVALSEEVVRERPLGVLCEGRPLVLFRDAAGVARALEDRCPHRRAPLSLGRMTADGMIQCGYHGWTFEGERGACKAIPNLRADEPVPARYAAVAFQAVEQAGFVFVRAAESGDAATPQCPDIDILRAHSGTAVVTLNHEDYVAALMDGPELLLRVRGAQITDYFLTDPTLRDGRWVIDRGAVRAGRRANHRFVPNYPMILRLAVAPRTGLTHVTLLTEEEAPIVHAVIAPTPAARGATAVRWRAGIARGGAGRLNFGSASPFELFDSIDGKRLSTLIVGPSRALRTAPAEDSADGLMEKTG